jgi:hypothetical protein
VTAGVTTGYKPVAMVVLPGGSGICTGTIVGYHAVLTAAHCAKTNGTYSVITSFGTFSTTFHPSFGAGVVDDPNDIAILSWKSSAGVADDTMKNAMIAAGINPYAIGNSVHSGDTLRLVGYGCTNLTTRVGAGVKRTGTNVVSNVSEYIEFLTPQSSVAGFVTGILGSDNRAGSCFGDSGGPALATAGSSYEVIGVTHAGGTWGSDIISEYIDMSRSDNRSWVASVATTYSLTIPGIN